MSKKDASTVASALLSRTTTGLLKVAADIQKHSDNLASLVETSGQVSEEIMLKQAELDEITKNVETSIREANAEIALQVKENKAAVLETLHAEFGLANVTVEQVEELRATVDNFEKNFSSDLESAVEEATKITAIQHKAELDKLSLEHQLQSSEAEARKDSDAKRIKDLELQVEKLEQTVSAERDARVQIETARSNQVVQVSSSN